MSQNKKNNSKRKLRTIRTQQIIFSVIAVIIILSWIISLVVNL